MTDTEPIKHEIRQIVVYTTAPWGMVLPVLRCFAPYQALGIEVNYGNLGHAVDVQKVDPADMVIIQRDFPRFTRECTEIVLRARRQGKPVIYETDDLLIDIPQEHISYPDISMYLAPMAWMLAEADLVTTSTPFLLDYMRPLQPRISLLPNYLHDRLWTLNPVPETSADRKLVIGYMGGDTHARDLSSITSTLMPILDRYADRVSMRFWGGKPPAEFLNHPTVEWTPLEMLDYADFASYFNQQVVDIAIAPLEDNLLNQAKSHIKFLEYSAIGAAGVYSKMQPYETIVRHGENGYLAASQQEWQTALAALIENPELRHQLASAAQMTIRKDWLLSANAWRWKQVLHEVSTPNERDLQKLELQSHILCKVQDRILELEAQRAWLAHQPDVSQEKIETLQQTLNNVEIQLANIQQNKSWKLLTSLQEARLRIVPPGSRREKILQKIGLLSGSRPG